MNLTNHISLYRNVKDTGRHPEKRQENEAIFFLEGIRDGAYRKKVEELQKLTQEEYDEQKKFQQGVTWSGIFNERKKTDIYRHSGLICFDLDHLTIEEIETLKQQFATDPYIFAAFISPSGKGLKFLIQTEMNTKDMCSDINTVQTINIHHEAFFLGFQHYFEATYKLKIDPSGKDCSRLCFLSYDPQMYFDDKKKTFGYEECKKYSKTVTKQKSVSNNKTDPTTARIIHDAKQQFENEIPENIGNTFEEIIKWVETKETYERDTINNNYIYLLACSANRKGISQSDTEGYVSSNYPEGNDKSILATIHSAYTHHTHEHGKFARTSQRTFAHSTGTAASSSPEPKRNSLYNDTVKFWYEVTTEGKDGKPKTEIKFDHDTITYFLANNGFRKIEVGDKFQFVRLQENKIEPVSDDRITHFIECYLSQNIKENEHGEYEEEHITQDEFHKVRQMFKRGKKTYCNEKAFNSLPVFTPRFLRDTENTAFLYFKNCFVEITKDTVTKKPYSQLRGHIWSKQIIQHEFSEIDKAAIDEAEFSRFMELAICGKLDDDLVEKAKTNAAVKEQFDLVKKKYLAAITGMGYMMHRFKDPANPKMVITVDKKLRQYTDSNGGSGKSMFFKAIGKIIHTCFLNGKSFKFDSPYPFETLNLDHGALVFNDVKKQFDVEELFHYSTEDFTFSKKYIDAITILYEDSPKIGIATNFSLKGSGSSFTRRQHIIEFSDYFNDTHTPVDVFGHRFFGLWWNEAEWNRFYNFMLHCIKMFLQNGLIAFPLENYGINKLIDVAGEEFVEWMDERVGNDKLFLLEQEYDKKEIFSAFKSDFPNVRRYQMDSSNRFTTWVKEWAKERGYEILEAKSDRVYKWKFVRKD